MDIEEIREAFKGYHVTIELYPSGGSVEIMGCDECKTNSNLILTTMWRAGKKIATIEDAVNDLRKKLEKFA